MPLRLKLAVRLGMAARGSALQPNARTTSMHSDGIQMALRLDSDWTHMALIWHSYAIRSHQTLIKSNQSSSEAHQEQSEAHQEPSPAREPTEHAHARAEQRDEQLQHSKHAEGARRCIKFLERRGKRRGERVVEEP